MNAQCNSWKLNTVSLPYSLFGEKHLHENPKMLEGRGGHYSIMFYMGRLPSGQKHICLRSNPLTLSYTIFDRRGSPSRIPSISKWYPIHIPTIKDTQLGSRCSDTCLSLFQCRFVMVFQWNCPSLRPTLKGKGKRRLSTTCQRYSFNNWPQF